MRGEGLQASPLAPLAGRGWRAAPGEGPRLTRAILLLTLLCFGCANDDPLPRLRGEWQSSTLPNGAYTHVVFRGYSDAFELRADGHTIYTFRNPAARDRLSIHVVELPRGARELRVSTTLVGDDAILATPSTLPSALVRVNRDALFDDATDILLGLLFAGAGLVALIAAAVRRRGDVTVLAAMGTFTLLYGLRLLVDSYLPLFLGTSLRGAAFAQAFLTYVIPVPGWFVPLRLMGGGWKSSLRWQVAAFAVFAPVAIAADLITGRPGSMDGVNNVLIVVGGVNLLVNLVRSHERNTPDLRVVLAGSVVFMLFALGNNLSALGLRLWNSDVETIGFLIFIVALGYAATRAFTKSERERTALDHELATAREIQRSILPTTMPNVTGLRFRARYDPATSVAGDLYDFLRVGDTHAGVLVADVAGHGVPAALIASMVKIAVSSQSKHDEPAAILTELNATLRHQVRKAFVTATYLWFDMTSNQVSVCNAGHAPPLLFRDNTFVDLGGHGVLLGRFASVRYTTATIALRAGDRIAAFTDGLVEARNARGEQFGEERLKELLANAATPDDIVDAVHRWRVDDDADDLTIVTIEITSAAATASPRSPADSFPG
jgi:phosphoserine phosphatase RsbU/P